MLKYYQYEIIMPNVNINIKGLEAQQFPIETLAELGLGHTPVILALETEAKGLGV